MVPVLLFPTASSPSAHYYPFFGKPQFIWSPQLMLRPCSGADAAVRRFWAPGRPSPVPAGLWGSCLGDLSDGPRGRVEGCSCRRTLGLALPHAVPGREHPPVAEKLLPRARTLLLRISAGAGHTHLGSETHRGQSHEHTCVCTHRDIHTHTCTHTQRHIHTHRHTHRDTFTHMCTHT